MDEERTPLCPMYGYETRVLNDRFGMVTIKFIASPDDMKAGKISTAHYSIALAQVEDLALSLQKLAAAIRMQASSADPGSAPH